ncbi:midcut-by-XrtH protein [Xylophilus sp. ASV27]|uniref:midcut-by-XrtH protein n=1 Tax=Xylophilus sp. ASV27 TaxID=2795129 RepID=UPI0018ECD5E7|nr:midcut-by-XrtH protein [Xylophilus sp. ASV27]
MTCKRLLRAGALALAAGTQAPAWAQAVGNITYAPLSAGTQSVPTLSQWGMAALALLLAAGARHLLRGHGNGVVRTAMLGLVAGAALLAMPWSGQALAVPASEVLLDKPAGGSVDLPDHPDFELPFADFMHGYEVRNTTDRPLRITAVDVTAAHRIAGPSDETRCSVDQTLAPLASCQIVVSRPH